MEMLPIVLLCLTGYLLNENQSKIVDITFSPGVFFFIVLFYLCPMVVKVVVTVEGGSTFPCLSVFVESGRMTRKGPATERPCLWITLLLAVFSQPRSPRPFGSCGLSVGNEIAQGGTQPLKVSGMWDS